MKKYLKDPLCTGSITFKRDGTVRLIIRDLWGRKQHDKVHKNERAATSAWYRYVN